MSDEDWSDHLFVGWGELIGVNFYRTYLPSQTLGAEMVAFTMHGHGVHRVGDRKKHRVIVVQHGWEHWQVRVMRRMKASGAFVVLNVDDWIPSVAKMGSDHALSGHFRQKDRVNEWRNMVKEADGVLCSTPWLLERCAKLNDNVALARNGLDLSRYERFRAAKEWPVGILGWAGGTGHEGAFRAIVPALTAVMDRHLHLTLKVVGDNVGRFMPKHLADRVNHCAWSDHHFYPRHLADFDINLAPALDNDFYKAKSQLRFYEACAMGTPTIGHRLVYDEIRDTSTGYQVHEIADWEDCLRSIIEAPVEALNAMRRRALDYSQTIAIESRISEWKSALTQLTSP